MKDIELLYLLNSRGAIRGKHTAILTMNYMFNLYRYAIDNWIRTQSLSTSGQRSEIAILLEFLRNEQRDNVDTMIGQYVEEEYVIKKLEEIDMTLSSIEQLAFDILQKDGIALDMAKDILKC